MGVSQNNTPSITCNLRIIRAKNIELKQTKNLHIRCYLSAGKNKNVQINTQEISSTSDFYFNNSFSLDCLGSQESINSLKQGNIVLELRSRNKSSVLGIIKSSSQLIGRAEIPWSKAFDSPNLEIETWVSMISKTKSVNEDSKPPAVQVAIEVKTIEQTKRGKNINGLRNWDECCCKNGGCNSCLDYDMFALGLASDL
ncbi:hypothetical protein LIER_20799 [Lithospermum erythrorhizon]|uniref:C2 domain-containing protein n=1 Tax=Lithospermum erythrorhizon TaxID=34254 RepID=A0AAV3QQT6_LITER